MNLRNFTLTSIKNIQEAQQKGKLIIFVGAGVSQNSNLPSWNDLVNQLAQDLGIEKKIIPEELEETLTEEQVEILKKHKIHYNTDECLKIPQYYFNEFGEKEYNNKLHNIFSNKLEPNPINYLIVELDPKHIITTNYDDLLEKTAESIAKTPYSKVSCDRDLAIAPNNNLIIKMHGELDKIVLKERDYDTYSNNFKLIETFVKGLIATNTILFVGFSAEDANVRKLFQWIHDILGNSCQPAYLLNTDEYKKGNKSKEEKRVKFEYLKEMGIFSLYYDEIQDDINQFVSDDILIDYNKKYKLKALEKGHGERLFKLLYFIQKKNVANDNSEYIENCYRKLKYLECLNYIPNNILAKVFGCNPKVFMQYGLYGLKPYLIKSLNELKFKIVLIDEHLSNDKYLELLYDNSFLDDDIKKQIYDIYNKYRAFKKDPAIENKLQNVISELRELYKIPKDEKSKIEYIWSRISSTEQIPSNNEEFKDIILYNSDGINNELKNLDIDYSENNVNVFKKAYLLIKFGKYKNAYYEFEKISYEANKNNNFILYIIASFNQYYLGKLINNKYYFKSDDKDIEIIKDQYLKINIEDLIERFIPSEIKDIIKYITSFDIFKELYSNVADSYDKISTTYQYIKNGGSSSNSYVHDLYGYLNEIFAYSNYNFYIFEYYEEYKKIFRKAFDGIFISYLTSLEVEANKEKLFWGTNAVPYFDYFDFYMLIETCKEKNVEKYLSDIPTSLKLAENKQDKLNLINAYKNLISGFIDFKIDNNFYSKFHLFFKIFSKIDFSQEEIFEIIDNFIKLINYVNNNELENKFNFNNTKNKTIYYFLVNIYNKNYPQKDFLNSEQLEKLLYLTIEESINMDANFAKSFNYDCMLRHICGILKSSNNSFKLKNQKKFLSLIGKINKDPYWKLFVITYIYPFIKEQDDLYDMAHILLENCSTGEYVDVLFQSIFSKIVKADKELVQKVLLLLKNELVFNSGRVGHFPYNVTLLQLLSLIDYFIKNNKLTNKKVICNLIEDLDIYKQNYFEQIRDYNFKENYNDNLMIIKISSHYDDIDFSEINIEILRYIKSSSLDSVKTYFQNNQNERDKFIEKSVEQLKNITDKKKYKEIMDIIKKLI